MKRRDAMRPVTAEDLARYLFGDPMDPKDSGLIGRLERKIETLEMTTHRQVRGVLMLGWAILVVLIGLLGTLIVNLLDSSPHLGVK